MSYVSQNDRRRFLKTLTMVLGTGASASLSTSFSANATANVLSMANLNTALTYDRAPESSIDHGQLFSQKQMELLATVCQTIIPKTDTPGAGDLDCHGFIDHQLIAVHNQQEQLQAIRLIDKIEEVAHDKYDAPFTRLTQTQQYQCLTNIESGDWSDDRTVKAFKGLKYLNAFGYFTSEVGATQVLNYQPVPGGYRSSVAVTKNTKNHGSLAFY